ncbi:hypothetical protein MJ1_0304 [Nanobdella aerobiophila]|uniref:Uncharacterized protein n=1 Tax=Nanobdella aerobiophila TaxID=2586965 RepID=A0A915SSL1_9ARCH|nr:hypothetical protein [Nanobdella aerobiophila]BBL45471.1 hypothetical protein MJ1_0304 [Nanobdella aerobiophila]
MYYNQIVVNNIIIRSEKDIKEILRSYISEYGTIKYINQEEEKNTIIPMLVYNIEFSYKSSKDIKETIEKNRYQLYKINEDYAINESYTKVIIEFWNNSLLIEYYNNRIFRPHKYNFSIIDKSEELDSILKEIEPIEYNLGNISIERKEKVQINKTIKYIDKIFSNNKLEELCIKEVSNDYFLCTYDISNIFIKIPEQKNLYNKISKYSTQYKNYIIKFSVERDNNYLVIKPKLYYNGLIVLKARSTIEDRKDFLKEILKSIKNLI